MNREEQIANAEKATVDSDPGTEICKRQRSL